eukprot:Rmarinus@m.20293
MVNLYPIPEVTSGDEIENEAILSEETPLARPAVGIKEGSSKKKKKSKSSNPSKPANSPAEKGQREDDLQLFTQRRSRVAPPPSFTTSANSSHAHSSISLSDMSEFRDPHGSQDFTTVDWVHDQDKHRNLLLHTQHARTGLVGRILNAYDACQGWLMVALVGCTTGLVAGILHLGVEWVFDLRFGYCTDAFYMNRQVCCKEILDTEDCDAWQEWHEVFKTSQFVTFCMYTLLSVVFAGYAAWLVQVYAPYATGSGIPEVKTILGGFVIKRFLGGWTLLIKCVGLVLTVGSGLIVGKEGPLVHVACCCANVLSRFFSKYAHNEAKKRELLSAASAAGVSAAFGAPIGGVLFSLEEVSSYFPAKTLWRSFFCGIAAALVLQTIDPLRTGKLTLFEITYKSPWHWFEMPFFCLIGVVGGLMGVLFIKCNVAVCRIRKTTQLRRFPVPELMAVALITSLFSYHFTYMQIQSSELIALLFNECSKVGVELPDDAKDLCRHDIAGATILKLTAVAVVKLGLAVITFGTRVPAGLFIPTLVSGACMGRAVGTLIAWMFRANPDLDLFASCGGDDGENCVTPGIYALVGAGAVLGGTTRMTVSLVVIMFELTGGLDYILPVMVGVLLSKWVGDALTRDGIYDEHIRLQGYPFLNCDRNLALEAKAEDVMVSSDLCVIPAESATVGRLYELMQSNSYQGYPVVTSGKDMHVVGYISRTALVQALRQAHDMTVDALPVSTKCLFDTPRNLSRDSIDYIDMRPWMDQFPIQISESTDINRVYQLFRSLGLRFVLVTHRGVLVGIIKKKDLIEFAEAETYVKKPKWYAISEI